MFTALCCFQVVWVPGCFEIPIVAQEMAKSGEFHAILCIGAVVSGRVCRCVCNNEWQWGVCGAQIRGATTHYDAVAGAAASGVLSASLNTGSPARWRLPWNRVSACLMLTSLTPS